MTNHFNYYLNFCAVEQRMDEMDIAHIPFTTCSTLQFRELHVKYIIAITTF